MSKDVKKEETQEEKKQREEATAQMVEKRKRFVENCTRRVQKVLELIESMQQFSSPNYAYEQADIEIVNNTISKKLKETTDVLLNPDSKKQPIKLFEM